MTAITMIGEDAYGRRWRVAPSGVEHIERPRGSEGGSPYRALAILTRGGTLAYCGRDITDLPASEGLGETKPCASCLRAEFSDD